MSNLVRICFVLLLMLSSCIGTDIVERTVPERVVITDAPIQLKIGDNHTFTARYFDNTGLGQPAQFRWSSGNEAVISITPQGTATAVAAGEAIITASAGNAEDQVTVTVGDETIIPANRRSGLFMGLNNYTVEGMFTLIKGDNMLTLEFAEDFMATNGPGLFIYLTATGESTAGGVELGEIVSNEGSQSYEVPIDVGLDTYDYVLVYCKPFGVPFGLGMFDE